MAIEGASEILREWAKVGEYGWAFDFGMGKRPYISFEKFRGSCDPKQ